MNTLKLSVSERDRPDAKVHTVRDGYTNIIYELWIIQDPTRKFQRRRAIGLTLTQAKRLRKLLDQRIAAAEQNNALARQR